MEHIKMTERQRETIDKMSHLDMAWIVRFAPDESIYFQRNSEVADHFSERWEKFGGMTPTISKQLGW